MNRLQKKCVLASGIMHTTLVVVLLVGPAFLGSSQQPIDPKDIIDFIPVKTIEQTLTGGGNPNVPQVIPPVAPPVPTPPRPETPPKPERLPDPDPVKPKLPDPPVKPVDRNISKPDPESLETSTKPSKPKVSLKLTTRNTNNQRAKDTAAEERAQAKAEANKRAEQISGALSRIRGGASEPVKIGELRGPGGGGDPYAGFNQALSSVYMRAWLVPGEVANSREKVIAVITLRRDGTVVSARIDRRSGNAELDKSVQRALDKVSYVAPLPESSKGAQDTFWLEFDPRLKPNMG